MPGPAPLAGSVGPALPDLGRRPALDGLRALAVAVVLADHANQPMPLSGGIGVTVFFVLSGFLITLLLLSEERHRGAISLGRFWVRRLLRLYPALLAMSAAVGVYLLVARPTDIEHQTVAGLFGAVFYVTNWVSAWSDQLPGLMTHTWSLSIEEQFYLFWPPILVGVRYLAGRWGRDREHAVLGVIAALVVLSLLQRRALLGEDVNGARLLWGTDTVAPSLLAGCALAVGVQRARWRDVITTVARWLGPLAVAALVWLTIVVGRTPSIARLGAMDWAAIAATVLIAWLVTTESWFSRILEHRALVWVGVLSYSLYLWHYPIFHIVRRETAFTGLTRTVVQVSISLAVAALSYRFIEQPFIRLKDRMKADPVEVAPAPPRGQPWGDGPLVPS